MATLLNEGGLVSRFSMSLKIDTGLIQEEVPEDASSTPKLSSNSSGTALSTPKGPLPTLLFARKYSLNVPRAIVKKAEEEKEKEKSAAASLVTQVIKTGPSLSPGSRPRTPSARLSQDLTPTTSSTVPNPPTSPSSSGMFNKMLSWGSKPETSAPVCPPSPSSVLSPSRKMVETKPKTPTKNQGLLAEQQGEHVGRKCLVLDLDETLVHSSFKPTKNPSFIIPVEIDGYTHQVYVGKRPNVDEFLERMGKIYEIVIFTASLSKYANPLLDILDSETNVIQHRLYREHCTYFDGCYVKDLTRLGRPMSECLIVDNASYSYQFHPENGIASDTWNDDPRCTELLSMADYLESIVNEPDLRVFTEEWNNASDRV